MEINDYIYCPHCGNKYLKFLVSAIGVQYANVYCNKCQSQAPMYTWNSRYFDSKCNLIKRALMLSVLENREYLRDVFISQRQCDIINFVVSKFKCFSVDVANKFDISVQSASTQMKRLYEIGYLDRKEVCSDSGGIEYEYTCAIKD